MFVHHCSSLMFEPSTPRAPRHSRPAVHAWYESSRQRVGVYTARAGEWVCLCTQARVCACTQCIVCVTCSRRARARCAACLSSPVSFGSGAMMNVVVGRAVTTALVAPWGSASPRTTQDLAATSATTLDDFDGGAMVLSPTVCVIHEWHSTSRCGSCKLGFARKPVTARSNRVSIARAAAPILEANTNMYKRHENVNSRTRCTRQALHRVTNERRTPNKRRCGGLHCPTSAPPSEQPRGGQAPC